MIHTIDESRVHAALPRKGFLREYVFYAARVSDANAAFHLGTGLALLAQTVPTHYSIRYSTRLYSNIYVLLVGSSNNSRKTNALDLAKEVLMAVLPERVGENPGSQEGLSELLRQDPQVLFFYTEFGDFLAQTEQGYLNALRTAFMRVYDCAPVGRALAKQQRGTVENPRVSIGAGVAPALLEKHTKLTDWTGGFLGRFFTLASERVRTYNPAPSTEVGRAEVVNLLCVRAAAAAQLSEFRGWSAEAETIWREWGLRLDAYQKNGRDEVQAALGRAQSMAAKIALLLAWDLGTSRTGEPWTLNPEEVSTAIQLTELHIESVINIGEFLSNSRDMRDRRTVLNSVGVHPISLGEIIKKSKLLKRPTQHIIETLLEEETIRQVSVQNKRGMHYTLAPPVEERAQEGQVVDIFSGAPRSPAAPIVTSPLAVAEGEDEE